MARWWRGKGLGPAAAAPVQAIAVLPFKNLSGDPGQDYFAAGLTEQVRAALAANAGLRVAAATSSARARDSEASATGIARELGVAYLLEGSVQRAGDIVRIATSLADGETGFTRWSQSIDRKLSRHLRGPERNRPQRQRSAPHPHRHRRPARGRDAQRRRL